MIRVNLAGTGRKKAIKTASKGVTPAKLTPLLSFLIVAGSAAGGYWWYASLTSESAGLDQQIHVLELRKAALEAVIKQDQIYETLKKKLENRVKVIEGLSKHQVSPILALDQLSEAIEKTQYVWLSSLEQKDAVLNMSGTGTSLNAIADFYTNLNATGYFKNVDLGPSQESNGNFSFSLKCEFAPPRPPSQAAPVSSAGGN